MYALGRKLNIINMDPIKSKTLGSLIVLLLCFVCIFVFLFCFVLLCVYLCFKNK